MMTRLFACARVSAYGNLAQMLRFESAGTAP